MAYQRQRRTGPGTGHPNTNQPTQRLGGKESAAQANRWKANRERYLDRIEERRRHKGRRTRRRQARLRAGSDARWQAGAAARLAPPEKPRHTDPLPWTRRGQRLARKKARATQGAR